MKTLKKVISCALTVFLLVSSAMFLLPAQKVQADSGGVYTKLMSLQSKFPNGKYWNHAKSASEVGHDCYDEYYADFVSDHPCVSHNSQVGAGQYDCNYFDGAWQCYGFANKVFFDVFGVRVSSLSQHGGSAGVSVGDFVKFTWQHYAVVLSVDTNSSTFTAVECNIGSDLCLIRWGHTYNLSNIEYYVHSNNYDAINITNKSPKGCVESCIEQYNNLLVRGWTYDPDESSKSISVDVYANDKFIKRISANNDSSSINSSYGISGNHRFSEYIELPEGNYTIKIYALDTSGNGNIQLGSAVGSSSTYNVTIGKSTKISNVVVSDISSDGYTVSCKVTDESGSGIYVVEFPTYSNADGRDDLINYCPPHETTDDIYSVRVNTSEHNNETGLFNTTIRAYDYNGNYTSFAVRIAVPERTFPTLKRINYVVDNDHLYVLYEGCSNWATAENYCVSVGGHLASITSSSENQVVKNLVSKGNENTYYFGAYDYGSEGTFVFTDGSTTASYTNWDKGEPNNSNSENYCDFYASGAWNDCNGTSRNGFILEIDLNKVSTADILNNLGIDLTKYYPQNRTKDDAVAWANSQVRSNNASSVDLIYRYFEYFGYSSQAYGIDASFANRSLPSGWKYVYSDYQPGDIAVWKTDMWSVCEKGNYNVDSDGFVGIISAADSTGFVAITQNFYYTQGSCSKVWFKIGDLQCAIRPAYAPSSYPITLKEVTNGTASLSKTSAKIGDEITVTATPDSGYVLDTIKVDGVAITGNKFSMPSKAVTVEVTFKIALAINTQPESCSGIIGQTANFKVSATGENLSYQWQVYKSGVWKATSLTGNKTDTLEVGVITSRDGMKFRCVVSDATGNSVTSDEVSLTVISFAITAQPVDYEGALGESAEFTVGVAGESISYQWQVNKSGTWKNTSLTGYNTSTLNVGIVESRDGMKFRCIVTNASGKALITDSVTLTVVAPAIEITSQPEDYAGPIGSNAEFTVAAEGENLTYQWQVYKSGAWKNTSLTGNTTSKLKVGIVESRNGMKFRCVITDGNGKSIASDEVVLTVTVPAVTITSEPEDYCGPIGDTAVFTVVAEGEELTYQWQVYKSGVWKNTSLTGNKTSTLEVGILESRDGMKFRCVVTDINGTSVASNEAIVTVGAKPVTITSEPEDYSGTVGNVATFEIEAKGENLTYQWQVYKSGAWKNTSLPGNTSSSLDVEITEARDGMTFRCVVKDGNGNKVISEEVTLSVAAVQNTITITTQPESAEKAEGETVIFNIEAEGEDLTYQWQVYKNGVWKNTSIMGNNAPSLIVDVLASRNGMKFRCVVTDANGAIETSDEVTLTIK